jgi:hypothetical protein
MSPPPESALISAARSKTEAYLAAIDAQRSKTVSSTDLEGAVPFMKKYVGEEGLVLITEVDDIPIAFYR